MQRLVVLGIGNTLMKDDGVGVHVARDLKAKQRASLIPTSLIEILDGGTLGYLLIDRISEADGLVIVDSANLHEAAGSIRVLRDGEVDVFLETNSSSSVHEVGLIDLLQMMSLRNEAPKLRAMVGVQPEVIGWGTDLSPVVLASVPHASLAVNKVLMSWLKESIA